jgi:hypothetical protein
MPDHGTDWLVAVKTLSATVSTAPVVLSILALALYALLNDRSENDDDDSSPGGGLMQPVA